jgi:hypothetical protein
MKFFVYLTILSLIFYMGLASPFLDGDSNAAAAIPDPSALITGAVR